MSVRNLILLKKQDCSTSISETSENVYLFVSVMAILSSLYLYTVFILMYKYLLELIKRRSKVQEKNMSYERTLNFDQWKIFSENHEPMQVWLWLAYKFTENNFSEFIQTQKKLSYLSWQNKYPSSKTTCHIKPKCFLWNKLPKDLLLANYIISVDVAFS